MTTVRAEEAARPSQPFQVVQAVCISREPSLKLPKRLRVVAAGVGTFHRPSLRSTPVKWIPQTGVIAIPHTRHCRYCLSDGRSVNTDYDDRYQPCQADHEGS